MLKNIKLKQTQHSLEWDLKHTLQQKKNMTSFFIIIIIIAQICQQKKLK